MKTLTRRLMLGAAAGLLPCLPGPALAAPPAELRGPGVALTIERRSIQVGRRRGSAVLVNGLAEPFARPHHHALGLDRRNPRPHRSLRIPRYIWGFDGVRMEDAEPIRLRTDERVRIILVNDTMMEHPIHLHGLWGELENAHSDHRPYTHSLIVQLAQHCADMRADQQRGTLADTPDAKAMLEQCDKLDKQSGQAQRRR